MGVGGWGPFAPCIHAPRVSDPPRRAQDAAFARLLLDERLTEPLADLLGDDLQLHHVKYHAKPPSTGTMFPMHMDYFYFPHELDTMTACKCSRSLCIFIRSSKKLLAQTSSTSTRRRSRTGASASIRAPPIACPCRLLLPVLLGGEAAWS